MQNSNLKINSRRKKYIILLTLSIAAITACTSTRLASVSDNVRGEISWNAVCGARGYDGNDNTYLTMNEYLDTWCGSVEEENAFIKAGVEPY